MFTNPGFTLADQMFWIVDLFMKTLTPEAGKLRLGGVLWGAIRNRVGRLQRRFCALYAMWKAGRLPKAAGVRAVAPPPPRPSPVKGEGVVRGAMEASVAMSVRPASLMPRGLRWMQKMLPLSAGALAYGVGSVVDNHPEIRAFVAECPQAGRVLRPLLRMAGLHPPEWLALPKRKRGPGLRRPSAASAPAYSISMRSLCKASIA